MKDDALLKAVHAAADALAALIPFAASFGEDITLSIKRVCAEVEPALTKTEATIAVVGDLAPRRALLRVVLGDVVGASVRYKAERTTRVRTAVRYDYAARYRDGNVIRFARARPDRDPAFAKSLERAESEALLAVRDRERLAARTEAARTELRALETKLPSLAEEIEAADQRCAELSRAAHDATSDVTAIERQTPQVPPLLIHAPPWWAVWLWVVRFMLAQRFGGRLRQLAANQAQLTNSRRKVSERNEALRAASAICERLEAQHESELRRIEEACAALATLEVRLTDESAIRKCHVHIEQLLDERQKYAGERKDEFLADLRAFDDTNRGDDLEELLVEYPTAHLPEGLVLVDANQVPVDADGFVLVTDTTKIAEPQSAQLLRTRLPQVLSISTQAGRTVEDAAPLLERVGRFRRVVVAARVALGLRSCIASIATQRAAAELAHRERLVALESQRIPDPTAFRAQQVARSERAIESGADDVLRAARAHLEKGLSDLDREWHERLARAAGKKDIASRAKEIDTTSAARIDDVLEATSELIAREMQSVTESLERWALDEVRNRYHTTARLRVESLAPVASDVTREDLAQKIFGLFPIRGAVETFDRRRQQFGLAGVASGAVMGTFVKPGLGTAVGAAIGLFAVFIKRPEQLRRECIARLEAYSADVKERLDVELVSKRDALIRGIREALDEALEETLARLNDSITRLMNVEKQSITREHEQLAQLLDARGTLEEHDAALSAALDAVRF